MKNNYFYFGTLIGLLIAAITGYSIMGKSFFEMIFSFSKYNGIIPVFGAVWTTLIMARWCDKNITRHGFLYRGLVIPIFIFSIGAITGSALNLMNMSGDLSLKLQLFDYFIKPIYWLGLIGLPATLIVGSAWYVVNYGKSKPNRI